MFNTSLEAEYTALVETLDFKWMDIVRLVENAIRSAWCDETKKNKLSEELRKHRSS
jgi:adenosine deaminase